MIHNPVLPGFNPDPCIIRRGNDYYIATSSFEWFPAVPVYHSKDLKHWELLTHAIQYPGSIDLRRIPSAKGVWAPDLSWCEADKKFYVVFTNMYAMNARFFDLDNFLISASDITGPWTKPVYLNSVGFDPSLFHDEDGRKYVISLQWETRDGYEKPGVIVAQEYDTERQQVTGYARKIWAGATNRGCIEAPRIYRHKDLYYLFCAEGGTGYGHSVTVARSHSIRGPYEADPENPIITSCPVNFNERGVEDALKLNRYNPQSLLQKSGHCSIVETPDGEWYAAHLCGRPFLPELRCTLGRETALQKMCWTNDGWFRMENGGNLAQTDIPEPSQNKNISESENMYRFYDNFESDWNVQLVSPRIPRTDWASISERPGWLRLYGQQSLASLDSVSFIAHRLTSVVCTFSTALQFEPEVFQQSAGLVLYYDNMNWLFLRVYYSEMIGGKALGIMRCINGNKIDVSGIRIPLEKANTIYLKCSISGRQTQLYYSIENNTTWTAVGPVWNTTEFSDEFSRYGEFTGTFFGLFCTDSNKRTAFADFDWLDYNATPSDPSEI
jgi:xylan 1,4-beta-xylosidase